MSLRSSLSLALLLLVPACGDPTVHPDASSPIDAPPLDAGPADAGAADAGMQDSGTDDAGADDAAVCTDSDGDGFFADCAPFDCDDELDTTFPGATELCDGIDQDCSEVPDEGCACVDDDVRPCGSAVGACEPGEERCVEGSWGACIGAIESAPEVCDGTLDENCDGAVDEGCDCTDGMSRSCGVDVGVCELGTQTCTGGAWGACVGGVTPTDEVCTGSLDEDCDGEVNEGCPAPREVSTRDSRTPILALDASGAPHIVFAWGASLPGGGSRFGLGYARTEAGAWVIDESLPEEVSNYPAFGFALDGADRPVVVIVSHTAPHHVVAYTREISGWVMQTISSRRGTRAPVVLRDPAGRLHVFAESYDPLVSGAVTEVAHFTQDGAGGWEMGNPIFRYVGDYSWGPFGVALGADGRFHGVVARRSTPTTPGGSVSELRYARPWADGTNWSVELAASNVAGSNEGFHRVTRDGAGFLHLTGTRSGWYYRHVTAWPVAGTHALIESGTNARAGVEIEPAASGDVLVYGEVATDRYVVRRLAPDGGVTTAFATPSLGVTPIGDAVSHDLVVSGSVAHLAYTASVCANPGCTGYTRQIHYATFAF